MDLLQENKKKSTKKTTAQKIVLTLLIISIVLCIAIGVIMFVLSSEEEPLAYSFAINGQTYELSSLQLLNDENNVTYISLRKISDILGYNYYNGEFKIAEESKTKGYINNKNCIIQFFTDSQTIYKTSESSNTDYEYYTLENPILTSEENLYIALDDLDNALNLILSYSEEKNQTIIETPEYWIAQREEAFEENDIIFSDASENMRTLSYGYVVISKDNKYGVISLAGEEIIGIKYNAILFSEYTSDFIVSNANDKFGVIYNDGLAKISLQYDSIEIINYEPLLYKVEKSEKYGIVNENGASIGDIKYDSFGYPGTNEIDYTLIIPNLNEYIPESIVVCSDKKYGLVDLETGKEIISCDVDGIYSVTEGDNIYYIVETQNKKTFLENFIKE